MDDLLGWVTLDIGLRYIEARWIYDYLPVDT